jgi:hypothetical protein
LDALEAAAALGFKTTSSIYELIKQNRLSARRVHSPHNNRSLRWDIDPKSVEEEKERRERDEHRRHGPPRYDVVLRLDDLHTAIEKGELQDMSPESVREWVRLKRAEAMAQQQQASTGGPV